MLLRIGQPLEKFNNDSVKRIYVIGVDFCLFLNVYFTFIQFHTNLSFGYLATSE